MPCQIAKRAPAVTSPIQAAVLLAFCVLVGLAAYSDFRRFIIPNRLSLAVFALYPAYVLAGPGIDWRAGLLVGAVVFGVCFALFAMCIVGGGDVKLLAATSVWAGTELLIPMLFIIAVVGGVYSLFTAVSAGRLERLWRRLRGRAMAGAVVVAEGGAGAGGEFLAVPYGVAIFVGALFVAAKIASGGS